MNFIPMKNYLLILSLAIVTVSCKNEKSITLPHQKIVPSRVKPKSISYSFQNTKKWLATIQDSSKIRIVLATNRTDRANIVKMDSIIVPKDLTGDLAYYLPFPLEVDALEEVSKIILFSYATQTFATYEYGQLIRTGPTNMGRKADKTPTGLFFTNWKAEKTTSTFNDEWDLKWNFNVVNKLGVGWHQYELPGYPASHSCLRLQERDAKYLYDWADQWELVNNETIGLKGTPVLIFGSYDFEAPKPWYQLVKNPEVLMIQESEIEKEVEPFLNKIISEQKKRENSKNNS